MRSHVVLAVFKRNFWSYFSGVIGYLFIVVFVFLGAFAAFQEKFFANNVASLDQLNEWFPQLLLFIIPAITMGIWSEERKLGTEELLFTLPVSNLEVLFGKYLAVVAVYTVALGFSLTNVLILNWIGSPDPGVIMTTYLGYWLAGCALLAAGMVASQLTSNATVAFVLGSALCAIPVFAERLSFVLKSVVPEGVFEGLSLSSQLKPFGIGLIPSQGLFYFVALAGLMLYINYVLIGYRHWNNGAAGTNMGPQYLVRSVSLLLILFGLGVVLSQKGFRSDWTAEKLYSFSSTTSQVVKDLKSDRPVSIQAFVSRTPPRDYVSVKSTLLGLLGQYGQSSPNVTVRIVEVDPASEQAEEAKQYGIEFRDVQFEREGRMLVEKVAMGAVINSGANEVVIPHFGKGTPIEYELTRSIQVAANEKRKTIGILESDAKLTGGFDMQTFRQSPEWRIVAELKKSYNVESVPASAPIHDSKFDVLISVLPSSLGANELENLVNYVKTGKPVLILDDPLPATNPSLAPRQPKPKAGGNPMMSMGMPNEQKAFGGKATSLVDLLGIEWVYDQIVWDNTSLYLHPEYEKLLREEIISISPQSGNSKAFNPDSPITNRLQEVMLFFSGSIKERELRSGQEKTLEFTPLLLTGRNSGLLDWDDLVKSSMFGMNIDSNPRRITDEVAHIVAAEIVSTKDAKENKINVIYVADTDLVSDFFFHLRETKQFNLDLDNVTFVLNAVDKLADDTAMIDLRNRRPKVRTLTAIERQTKAFNAAANEERKLASDEAKKALKDAKDRLAEKVEKIKNNESLDEDSKMQQLMMAQQEEARRLEVEEANINQAKEKKIDESKTKMDRLTREVESSYYTRSLLASPIPAIMLGLIVWLIRKNNEQRDIAPARRIGGRG
ncbi:MULTISPECIES: Gldg family protein [unclassified Schlesneria]|uniref:Gldg family protein n=1 Tax=Schlesneria TaxID=656899 RepID=UPI0035A0A3AB